MTTVQMLVSLTGIGAIGWVNYYFFLARPAGASAALAEGQQRVRVEVDGGYSPAVIRVRVGQPVRLEFDRRDTGSCTEEVVLGDFGIRAFLPPGKTTAVEFTPTHSGTYEFACGMGMVRGKVIAK